MCLDTLPSCEDYATALQLPRVAFQGLDATLVDSQPVYLANGHEIWSAPGGYAVVFKMRLPSGNFQAVRCFHGMTHDSIAAVEQHYTEAAMVLRDHPCAAQFVRFEYRERGIRVKGRLYPIVIMDWLEGSPLKDWIEANRKEPLRLWDLAVAFFEMSQQCIQHSLVHGDIHHENIVVLEQGAQITLKWLDYDTLYFADRQQNVPETTCGLPDYQHPLRTKQDFKHKSTDYFSQFSVLLSILALAENPVLWDSYDLSRSEALIFKKYDYENPYQSLRFGAIILTKNIHFQGLLKYFQVLCLHNDFTTIPSLVWTFEEMGFLLFSKEWNMYNQKRYEYGATSPSDNQRKYPKIDFFADFKSHLENVHRVSIPTQTIKEEIFYKEVPEDSYEYVPVNDEAIEVEVEIVTENYKIQNFLNKKRQFILICSVGVLVFALSVYVANYIFFFFLLSLSFFWFLIQNII